MSLGSSCRKEGAMDCRPLKGLAVGMCVLFASTLWGSTASAQAKPPQPAPAQMNMNMDHRGGIAGTVRNPAGAAAAEGLTVVATNADNGARFTATTDARGQFAFPALPVGKYTLSIEAAGITLFRQAGIN